MENSAKKPKLIVFDLDYTLWPFWVDTHVSLPLKKNKDGKVVDSRGNFVQHYPEVPCVLKKLTEEGYILGVASRTAEVSGANQALELFGWNRFIQFKEIYPGCKVSHFNEIKKKSHLEFQEMLFFDDEHRNIRDLEQHGVVSILVEDGISFEVVKKGMEIYASRQLK